MTFELFTEYGAASRNTVTLRKSGQLFIPYKFTQKDAKKYHLWIDKENLRLAIKIEDIENDHVKKLMIEKSGVALNLIPVINALNINWSKKSQRLKPTIEEGAIILDLKEIK